MWRSPVVITHPPIASSHAIDPAPTCVRRQGTSELIAKYHPNNCCIHGKCLGPTGHPPSVRAVHMLAQLVEQRLRALEILCAEPLGEPAVDWCENAIGLRVATAVAGQLGEADCGAQLPEL